MTPPTHLQRSRARSLLCASLAQWGLCCLACSGPAAPPDSPVGYTEQRRLLALAGGPAVATNAPAPGSAADAMAATTHTTPAASTAQTAPPSSTPSAPAAPPTAAPAVTTPVAPAAPGAASMVTPPPAGAASSAPTTAAPSEATKNAEVVGPKATKLKVQFTTKSYGGMYQPVNLGAVWVEDASGKWVYTLEMWCGWQNTKSLKPYNSAGGADYSVGLFPGSFTTMPPMDVVTSATLRQHKPHNSGAWSLKDSKGAEVPDGMYKLKLEVTEQEDEGKVLEVPFMKGAAPGPIAAPDSAVFTNLKIELQ